MGKTAGLFAGLVVLFASISSGADWQIEVLEAGPPGKFSTLKVDTNGNLHLAYVLDDGVNNVLNYAFWDRTLKHWYRMPVDQGASFCSLVLDSKQHPHISYADSGGGSGAKLRYAYWDGQGAWKKRAIPLYSEIVGYYTSIVLDSHDRPSISFYEYRGPKGTDIAVRMRIVSWNGDYWQVQTVDGQNQSGKFNALAIDKQGHKHLVYANVNALTTSMRYAYWEGASWRLEIFDEPALNNGGYVGYAANLVLDKEGNPHTTYMNYSTPAVKYAVRKNGRWQIQTVERLAGVGYPDRNGITVTDMGDPYISYYDAGLGALRLAHRKGEQWMIESVDGNAAGFTSSVQIDRESVWIAYADEGTGGLKVARRPLNDLDSVSVPGPTTSVPGPTTPIPQKSDPSAAKIRQN